MARAPKQRVRTRDMRAGSLRADVRTRYTRAARRRRDTADRLAEVRAWTNKRGRHRTPARGLPGEHAAAPID